MKMVKHNAIMQFVAVLKVKLERCFQDSWNNYTCAEGAYLDRSESPLPINTLS